MVKGRSQMFVVSEFMHIMCTLCKSDGSGCCKCLSFDKCVCVCVFFMGSKITHVYRYGYWELVEVVKVQPGAYKYYISNTEKSVTFILFLLEWQLFIQFFLYQELVSKLWVSVPAGVSPSCGLRFGLEFLDCWRRPKNLHRTHAEPQYTLHRKNPPFLEAVRWKSNPNIILKSLKTKLQSKCESQTYPFFMKV